MEFFINFIYFLYFTSRRVCKLSDLRIIYVFDYFYIRLINVVSVIDDFEIRRLVYYCIDRLFCFYYV